MTEKVDPFSAIVESNVIGVVTRYPLSIVDNPSAGREDIKRVSDLADAAIPAAHVADRVPHLVDQIRDVAPQAGSTSSLNAIRIPSWAAFCSRSLRRISTRVRPAMATDAGPRSIIWLFSNSSIWPKDSLISPSSIFGVFDGVRAISTSMGFFRLGAIGPPNRPGGLRSDYFIKQMQLLTERKLSLSN